TLKRFTNRPLPASLPHHLVGGRGRDVTCEAQGEPAQRRKMSAVAHGELQKVVNRARCGSGEAAVTRRCARRMACDGHKEGKGQGKTGFPTLIHSTGSKSIGQNGSV
ncbi:MAG: hypothetical protein ACK56I_22255, partial [bacterium]